MDVDKTPAPWDNVPQWKGEKDFLNWLRSSTRRIWSRHPTKIEYKKHRRYKAPVGKHGKDVWVSDCEICGEQSRDTEIDHIDGGYGFSNWEEYCSWAKRILWVTFDDIRELCKECHEAVTLSQRERISFEQAKIEKKVISICKAKKDKEWLMERGIQPASNASKREEQIRSVLNESKAN